MTTQALGIIATHDEQNVIYRHVGLLMNFMLKKPELIKATPKFGKYRLGKIKGSLSRRELYEDR